MENVMKKFLVMMVLLTTAACSSTHPPEKVTERIIEKSPGEKVEDNLIGPRVANFKEVEYLNRQEVIQASKDCINARMRPVVQYVPQKTKFGTLMLPAVVNCEQYTPNR
jgi:hypothetical protein